MGYSQALVLLGLPEEERAEFIAGFDLVAKGLDDLFGTIGEMAPADPETFALYILRVNRFIWASSRRLRSLVARKKKPAPQPRNICVQ